jgi:hypothetical protein
MRETPASTKEGNSKREIAWRAEDRKGEIGICQAGSDAWNQAQKVEQEEELEDEEDVITR